MPSYWEWIISKDGRHYLTAKNQFMMERQAREMLADLKTRFQDADGFKVTLHRWECYGRDVTTPIHDRKA